MNNLQVRITHKSGRVTNITSQEYKKGQFGEWCARNFQMDNGLSFGWVIWNDSMINVNEIEKIEEITN